KKLKRFTNDIYIRENRGFDFGAYKEVIRQYLSEQEINSYQKLILCNDTCFGPFTSFVKIFSQMDIKDLDFWSMNYIDDLLLPHFQSYFMVFKKDTIKFLRKFLEAEIDEKVTDIVQAHGYEHALSEIILKRGIKYGYYTSKAHCSHDIDIYGAPDYAIKELGLPLIKKKVFSGEFNNQENAKEALRLIAAEENYPIRYILEYVRRVYKKEYLFNIDNPVSTTRITFEKNCTKREDVIEFCRNHERVYVYGNGYMSVLFMARFRRYMNEFGGYIVSDEYYMSDVWKGEKVYPLSSICKDVPIIVALMKESAQQVVNKFIDRKNVLYLSINQK
ncbi:MAG: hypothetical protein HFH87_13080, partial [Lachnospiraceae bacterium]|nr:hypothetical protein [Lachnospiraceae bacterium]